MRDLKFLLAPLYILALFALYWPPDGVDNIEGIPYWPPRMRAPPGDFCGGASAAVVQQRTLQALSGMGVAAERAVEVAREWGSRCAWTTGTP